MKTRIASRSYVLAAFFLVPMLAYAGGPLVVAGPNNGTPGQPMTWAQGAPINYRVDGGPLSQNGATIVVTNAAGVTRVQSMFQAWQAVTSASLDIRNAGAILPVPSGGNPATSFSDGDVNTASELDAVQRSCDAGTQSPIVFDANGAIFSELGLPSAVIGFASPCQLSNGHIISGMAVLNGIFIDGVSSPPNNYEMPPDAFDAAFIHEFGHFLGLDHSQVSLNCYTNRPCGTDSEQGLPTMFPILMTVEQKSLAPDDIAWISKLYPKAGSPVNFGTISGRIYFYDGISAAQGVNVIARAVNDPATPGIDESRRTAISVVSGFKFTGNPGQSVTGTNTAGSSFGSRDPLLIGYYEIPVPPGQYTVEVESILSEFDSGSSVGPLDPPIPMPGPAEKYHAGQSNNDNGAAADVLTVDPGATRNGIDFILNQNYQRFDAGEDGGSTQLMYPDIGLGAELAQGGAV